jgi:hypothetical protein
MNKETLEDAAEHYANMHQDVSQELGKYLVKAVFQDGAEWQAEQIPFIIEHYLETAFISKEQGYMNPKDWFKQYKKK